jgi:hypothetical protein
MQHGRRSEDNNHATAGLGAELLRLYHVYSTPLANLDIERAFGKVIVRQVSNVGHE